MRGGRGGRTRRSGWVGWGSLLSSVSLQAPYQLVTASSGQTSECEMALELETTGSGTGLDE